MTARRRAWHRWKRPGGLGIALALVAQLSILAAGTQAQTCKLEPQLRDVLITQGTGSSPLVWGKDTLWRGYLTAPACAGSGALKYSNASLKMKIVGLPDAVIAPVSVPALGAEPSVTDCCVVAVDNPADPVFSIDGSHLSPAALAGGFAAAFELTVTYIAGTSTGTVTFLTFGDPPKTITANFGTKPNPLRMLVVPMGDKSKTGQYTSTTQANVQTSVETLARIFPVSDLVGTSTAANAGVRWQQATDMLDLGVGTATNPGLNVLNRQGKFCGNAANFPPVKTGLANFLQAFNSANPANPADFVVGAVDGAISVSSSTDGSCYEGIAAYNSRESWFRVLSDGSNDPSISGAVLPMEIGHNITLVNDDRADIHRHSKNIVAETENRAYNLTERSYLADDKSVMRFFGIWHRQNTLLERPDWIFARCKLGGVATGETAGCTGVGGVGASAASSRRVLRISGSTDGTKAGTELLSNFTSGGALSEADPASEYRLIFRDPTGPLQEFRLPVSTEFAHGHEEGHEAGSGAPPGGHDERGVIDADVLQDAEAVSATHIEVWKGPASANDPCGIAPTCLYEAEITIAPELDEVQINPSEWIFEQPNNFTGTVDRNEIQPSLSFDGQFLSYVEERDGGGGCGSIVIERVDKAARGVLGTQAECRSEPTMGPDNETLIFARDGDLWRIRFDPVTLDFFEDSEKKVYACVRQAGACITDDSGQNNPLTGPASGPSFSPTPVSRNGQWVAFSVEGDIFRLFPYREDDVAVPDPLNPTKPLIGITRTERITGTDEADSEPTVSDGGPSARVAFTRRAEGAPPTILTVGLPSGPLALPEAQPVGEVQGRHPSWGGNLIAYEAISTGGTGGRIGVVNPDDPSTDPVTTTGMDTWPSILPDFGKTMAIQRTDSGQDDIYLGVTGKRVDVLLKGRDGDNAAETAGYIYIHCGGTDVPIGVDLTPHHPDPDNPQLVTFTADNHDTSLDCGPGAGNLGKAGGLITDDWSLSNKAYSVGTVRQDSGAPIAAIHYPSVGSLLRIDASIPLDGSGWDPEGMVLPGSALTWELQLPGRTTWTALGAGNHIDARPQNAGLGQALWPLGTYRARLTANDGTSSTSSVVEFELSSGLADFDPNTLYVPSSGNDVTAYVTLQPESLHQVSVGDVQLVELGGYELGEAGNPAPIAARRWSVSGSTGTVKFDRQKVSSALIELGLVGVNAEFVLRINTSTFTFYGVDIVRVEPA